jgi:regulator of cell morphogenesis and NO signaling
MISIDVLNVSLIEPKLKHPTIFRHFDELGAGESFMIDNDHDPKPLYYELLGERGNIFTWEYTEEGPERWKVILTKKDPESSEDNSDISEKDLRKAELLKAKGIEFNCNDSKPAVKYAYTPVTASQDYTKWNLDFLTQFISCTHHKYLKDTCRVIGGLSMEVADHHGADSPELIRLAQCVSPFVQNLTALIERENTELFPAIRELVDDTKEHKPRSKDEPEFIKRKALVLQREHAVMQEDLEYMRRICNNYRLPKDACNSHGYLYQKLIEMETDLEHLFYLEDQILSPRAIAMESEAVRAAGN